MGQKESKDPEYGYMIENEKEGESGILRNSLIKKGQKLYEYPNEEDNTILKCFERTVNRLGDKNFLGTRKRLANGNFGKYEWKSLNWTRESAKDLGRGVEILKLGNEESYDGEKHRFVGIYGKNREEWVVTEISTWYNSSTFVPLYDTMGEENLAYIICQTNLSTIFTSEENIPKMLSLVEKRKCESIKTLVCFESENPPQHLIQKAKDLGINIISFQEVINSGMSADKKDLSIPCIPSTLAMICYTSGTTGEPKGVMLSHRNLLACVGGIGSQGFFAHISNNDSYLSYLPLAHVYEQLNFGNAVLIGVRIGFYQGNILKLTEDLQELQPTTFCSVPRLFNRFYSVLKQKMEEVTGFRGKILQRGLKNKLSALRNRGKYSHIIYDNIAFKKMRKIIGGKIKLMVSSAAPIEGEVLDMLKVCFSCPIQQAYGQTESGGAGCVSAPEDLLSTHVGPPYICTELKLRDIPDMEYFSTDKGMWNGVQVSMPRGEVMLHGPCISPGYFRDSVNNRDTFVDGWLATGDVGVILPGGRVRLIDRKSNFFKLQQGEFIAVEKLENVYILSPYIAQLFLYGDGLRQFLVAIIVLDPDYMTKVAAAKGLENNIEKLCKNGEIKKDLLANLEEIATKHNFSGLEKIKNIYMTPKQFTVEDGTMTPTFKVKRKPTAKFYASVIDELYE